MKMFLVQEPLRNHYINSIILFYKIISFQAQIVRKLQFRIKVVKLAINEGT